MEKLDYSVLISICLSKKLLRISTANKSYVIYIDMKTTSKEMTSLEVVF